MGTNRGGGAAGPGSGARIDVETAASMTLVSCDADAGYPAEEFAAGRIVYMHPPSRNTLIVEYSPDGSPDAPPLDVREWALVLADDDGAVLASGVVTQSKAGAGEIRRYRLDPDRDGPAPRSGRPWA